MGLDRPSSARLAALRLLGRRDLTEVELTRRLTDRGYPPSQVQETVKQLAADGTVDDRRTAAAHARTASRVKGRGRLRIRRELEHRGVDPNVVGVALREVSTEDEIGQIRRVLARRLPASGMTPEVRRRLYRQLVRRGFDPALITKVLRSSDVSDPE